MEEGRDVANFRISVSWDPKGERYDVDVEFLSFFTPFLACRSGRRFDIEGMGEGQIMSNEI